MNEFDNEAPQIDVSLSGAKQKGTTDLQTIKTYHPEVLQNAAALMRMLYHDIGDVRYNNAVHALENDAVPVIMDFPGSGYRDAGSVIHDEHCYALAVDVQVNPKPAPLLRSEYLGNIEMQISIARRGIYLFTRFGIYPKQNTMHWGMWNMATIAEFEATQFWVKWPISRADGTIKVYHGFNDLDVLHGFIVKQIGG